MGVDMDSRRKLVFGRGLNDGWPGETKTKQYKTWHNMLKRCYCSAYHKQQPTYKGCSVADEWLRFSNFRDWMNRQDWRGKELDKDVLEPGNRVYSPSKCVFISRQINSLLHTRVKSWPMPQGVYFDVSNGKYRAEFTCGGKKTYIGVFNSPADAGRAYRSAKAAHIRHVANSQPRKVRDGLLRHADELVCK